MGITGKTVQCEQYAHIRSLPAFVVCLRLPPWTCQQFLVTRSREDFVTWVDGSKIKLAIKTYEDKVDDFDLLGEG